MSDEHSAPAPSALPSLGGSAPTDAERQKADLLLANNADVVIDSLCNGGRWRMSIPVREDDSDVVLSKLVQRFRELASRATLPSEGARP